MAQMVRMQETWIRSLDWEDLLEEDMATHFTSKEGVGMVYVG